MMPKPKITIKEAKLIKGIAEGKTKQKSAMEAYGHTNPATASVAASKALRKGNVQEALQLALEKHGITIDQAIAPISKALTAQKVQITGAGDQLFAELVEDLDMQLKGSDRALKLMGVGQNREDSTVQTFIQINNDIRDKYV